MVKISSFTINPLMPNNLYIRHALSPLNSRMTYIYLANNVSKFGGIFFTPIRLTAVARYASGPIKVRLFIQELECTPSSPKPHHKHWYICKYLIIAHFFQLTNTVLTQLALTIAWSGVHCGLKYQHWPMKRTLVVDQKVCQWCTVPI